MAGNNELEKTLWTAADKLRSNMDAAEYKHIVLGLIFLKYISDAFSDLHEKLKAGLGEFEGADPELNKQRLGELIDLIGTIGFTQSGHQAKDLLGWVYVNMAIRGIDAKIELGDTFLADKHKDLKADFILANPPFNVSGWSGENLQGIGYEF